MDIGPIYAIYHKTPLQIIPDDISPIGADKTFAFRFHRSRVTIEQYIFCRYSITLKYPHLPCMVMHGSNGHKSYYPFELLYIDLEQYIEERTKQQIIDELENINPEDL